MDEASHGPAKSWNISRSRSSTASLGDLLHSLPGEHFFSSPAINLWPPPPLTASCTVRMSASSHALRRRMPPVCTATLQNATGSCSAAIGLPLIRQNKHSSLSLPQSMPLTIPVTFHRTLYSFSTLLLDSKTPKMGAKPNRSDHCPHVAQFVVYPARTRTCW